MTVPCGDLNVKYDDWGWHFDGALGSGQPEIYGFTHIGMYLVWIIKHDMSNPELLLPDVVARVKSGEVTAHDLADEIDGKLTAEEMTAEGMAFSDWYYAPANPRYLDDWAATFSREIDYGVDDTPDNSRLIDSVIDKRYRDWIRAGRPAAPKPRSRFSALCGRTQRLCSPLDGLGSLLESAWRWVVLGSSRLASKAS